MSSGMSTSSSTKKRRPAQLSGAGLQSPPAKKLDFDTADSRSVSVRACKVCFLRADEDASWPYVTNKVPQGTLCSICYGIHRNRFETRPLCCYREGLMWNVFHHLWRFFCSRRLAEVR